MRSLFQVELSAKCRVTKAFQLFFKVVSLSNADIYRRTFKGGVRANF